MVLPPERLGEYESWFLAFFFELIESIDSIVTPRSTSSGHKMPSKSQIRASNNLMFTEIVVQFRIEIPF